MHDAFEADLIFDKLPLEIESISCYENILLVGTRQGHLLQYKIEKNAPTDNIVSVHDLNSLGLVCIVGKTKGATLFSVDCRSSHRSRQNPGSVTALYSDTPCGRLTFLPDLISSRLLAVVNSTQLTIFVISVKSYVSGDRVQHSFLGDRGLSKHLLHTQPEKTQSGDIQYYLRLSVAVKRKIQLFYWKKSDFHELLDALSVYDVPQMFSWCKDSLCVGFKRDYYVIDTTNGNLKELFPVGAQQVVPLVTRLGDERLLVQRDKMSVIINADGEPTSREPINWSDIPVAMAILPKFVEVRSLEPKLLIQKLQLNKATFICHHRNVLYIASQNDLWCLQPISVSQQIRDLLKNKQFELALLLANQSNELPDERGKQIRNIKNLHAFDLFCKHQFEKSLVLFASLGTDPSHVIGLYPNLLPEDYRSVLEYPDIVPNLKGHEIESGIQALINYLTQKRNELVKKDHVETSAIVEGCATIQSKKQLSQIIDTTLLKCYLQTCDALVAPLLRLKDNNCHVEECERVLEKENRLSELIILYETKGMHHKALNFLMNQAVHPDSQLKDHERTIQYLQNLGVEHLDLIFQYAEWVLHTHPTDGLAIFTEDIAEVDSLPRDKVLDYLERTAPSLAISYLEHVIFQCDDTTPHFHNHLILLLKDEVQSLMNSYLCSLPEGHLPVKAGTEPGSLGENRSKLLYLLNTSKFYAAQHLLTHFSIDERHQLRRSICMFVVRCLAGFHEERAILLGRFGRHQQALSIYIHILHDSVTAEEYCQKHYNELKLEDKDVYLHLLKTYLHPPDMSVLGMVPGNLGEWKTDLNAALKLLVNNADKFDVIKALEILPDSVRVSDLSVLLASVMDELAAHRRHLQMMRTLRMLENRTVTEQRMQQQKFRVEVTELTFCPTCKRRIGDSAFYYTPFGNIYHYSCYKLPT